MSDADKREPASSESASSESASSESPAEEQSVDEQSFSEQLSAAMRQSAFGKVDPTEAPTFTGMLSIVGGVRGLVESFLPGLVFLVTYSITKSLPLSLGLSIAVAIGLIIGRAVNRLPLTPAISGAIGIALTAALALLTNHADNNFLPGIIINSGVIVVLLVSLLVGWPFVGVIVGLLMADHPGWRSDPVKKRAFVYATIIWIIPSVIRVAVQVPLYLASLTEWLAGTKLITGLPLYAAALWLTWMLVRRVYPGGEPEKDLETPE